MKFFRKFRAQLKESIEANKAAEENSHALLKELDRTEPHVDEQHDTALRRLRESETQARRLRDADRRNHYSEGLTRSFQGRTAT